MASCSLLPPAGHIEAHLRYPHCWVWLTASQLFGQLFASQQPQGLVQMWREEGEAECPLPVATAFLTSRLDKKVTPSILHSSLSICLAFLLLFAHWGRELLSVCLLLFQSCFSSSFYFLFFSFFFIIFFLSSRACFQMRECVLSFSHQLLSRFLDTASGEQVTMATSTVWRTKRDIIKNKNMNECVKYVHN